MTDMHYLHIPKCGSTFATILVRLGCGVVSQKPRLSPGRCLRYRPGHSPLNIAVRQKVVTMMREPSMRTVSGFMHILHDAGELQKKYNISQTNPQDSKRWHSILREMNNQQRKGVFNEYVEYTRCCMINMINGIRCGKSKECSSTEQALARMHDFHFIGIQEMWKTSIQLFAKMHGTTALPVEIAASRVQNRDDIYNHIVELSRKIIF